MIKANELRIGNLIKDYEISDENNGVFAVEQIRPSHPLGKTIGVSYRENSCWTSIPEPIPLDEEWFLKLGFVGSKYHYEKGIFEAGLDGDDFINDDWTIRMNKSLYIKIKYVHELQNLYFALTGQELQIDQ